MKTRRILVSLAAMLLAMRSFAQSSNGLQAINETTSTLKSYFTAAANLMLVIGAIVGLVGAIMVYAKFSSGDPESGKKLAAYFGAAFFLSLAPTILRAFFM